MSTAAGIRRQMAALGARRRRARIPEALRREIASYARRGRAAGAGVLDIARETGVSAESVRRWMSPARGVRARQVAMLPVKVLADHRPGAVILITPGGVRVEGLDVEGAGVLLRHLP